MSRVSKVFYFINAVISFGLFSLFFTLGVLGLTGIYEYVPQGYTENTTLSLYVLYIIVSFLYLASGIFGLVGGILMIRGSLRKGFHIFCLIMGIFYNPLLFFGGLFGILSI